MRVKSFWFSCVFACLTLIAAAQEGYPLIGTWSGEWSPSPKVRDQVLVIMDYTSTTLSGVINPGEPDEAPIRVGTLDSRNWTVHLEAEYKDQKGTPVKIVIDGKLEDIGSHNRTITGTWTRGSDKGQFKLTRE
ncbi:MAG TPA: hypothetical protein VM818_03100 [Vicinamibacterales bacterium]|jgi:hypothetical protein|nr:hypothetical protein [Vicinamibacterales bacterium]